MPRRLSPTSLATLFVALPLVAAAQASPAPSAAAGQVGSNMTPIYRSAFEGYRAYKEEKVGPWRDANDVVGRIGGWQAYARESQEQPPADKPAQQASSAPSAQGKAVTTPNASTPEGERQPNNNHDQHE